MKSITSIFLPLVSFATAREAAPPVMEDRNDPAESADLLGTVCGIHGCQRTLDEAPVVSSAGCRDDVAMAKRQLFPNSWKAIVSVAPHTRGGWFHRSRPPKMIAVRYCEECRAAAERWMQEHVEEPETARQP